MMWRRKETRTEVEFETLRGETLTDVEGCEAGSAVIRFRTASGQVIELCHDQDCCEHVEVVQVDGEPRDLIGHVLTLAEEAVDPDEAPITTDGYRSETWTFYRLGCMGGYVTVRWLGESSGYYSERVTCYEVTPKAGE